MNAMDFAYRNTAAVGASGMSLLLPLFDRLANDLRRGAEAQRAGDLECRSRELHHALAIVGFLENWIDRESGELARQLSDFYTVLRRRVVEAQAQQSAAILDEQMSATLKLREVWHKVQSGDSKSEPEVLPPTAPQWYAAAASSTVESRELSWSA
jgi:flagellar biosynthetic protein FliS